VQKDFYNTIGTFETSTDVRSGGRFQGNADIGWRWSDDRTDVRSARAQYMVR
jgi:hypothetical protein